MSNIYSVGLTGNIASGKSTVANLFRNKGVPIISADHIAKQLTTPQQPTFKTIKEHFGDKIINSIGELNRAALRELIFENPAQRLWLEQLLHPLIRQTIQEELLQLEAAYAMIEIPLLLSCADYPYLNRILLIQAPQEQQISRLMQRDNISEKLALAILSSQPDAKLREDIADDFIINNNSISELAQQVDSFHQNYLYLAKDLYPFK